MASEKNSTSEVTATEGIDVFHSSVGEEKTFRIIHYDIAAQKLRSVHILKGTEFSLPVELIKACENIPIVINWDGSVKVTVACDPRQFIVRATGLIKVHKPTYKQKFASLIDLVEPNPNSIFVQRYIYRSNTVTNWTGVQRKLRQLE